MLLGDADDDDVGVYELRAKKTLTSDKYAPTTRQRATKGYLCRHDGISGSKNIYIFFSVIVQFVCVNCYGI